MADCAATNKVLTNNQWGRPIRLMKLANEQTFNIKVYIEIIDFSF